VTHSWGKALGAQTFRRHLGITCLHISANTAIDIVTNTVGGIFSLKTLLTTFQPASTSRQGGAHARISFFLGQDEVAALAGCSGQAPDTRLRPRLQTRDGCAPWRHLLGSLGWCVFCGDGQEAHLARPFQLNYHWLIEG
jgi:hypothetical protein